MPRDITALGIALYNAYKDDPIPYCYGCCGQAPSKALFAERARTYPQFWAKDTLANPKKRTPEAIALKATFCCDCIGWIRILCLYDAKVNPLPWPQSNTNCYTIKGKNWYNIAAMDISANQMRDNYGGNPMRTLAEPTNSQAVFVSMNGHIGLYIGNGWVIEQTPPKLQKTKLADRGWTSWGYIPTKWRDFIEVTVGLGSKMDCSVKGGKNNVAAIPASTSESKPAPAPTPAPAKQKYTSYTVVKGDSPWSIAEKLSKNGANYTKLVWLTKSDGGKPNTYQALGKPLPYEKGKNIFAGEVLGYPV